VRDNTKEGGRGTTILREIRNGKQGFWLVRGEKKGTGPNLKNPNANIQKEKERNPHTSRRQDQKKGIGSESIVSNNANQIEQVRLLTKQSLITTGKEECFFE